MPLNAIIRKALPVEIEALADMAYVAWERDLLPFLSGPAASRSAEKQRLLRAVRQELDQIIVADIDAVAVGWCARTRSRAYIPFLFVTPLLQNQGIGSLLLTRMESMLELSGADRVQLDTLADNVRAVSFYQHHGYSILVRPPGGGSESAPGVRLEKRLAPYRGAINDVD